MLRHQKRHEEALALMRRSTQLEPDAFLFHSEFAEYLRTQGRLIEARGSSPMQ